MIQVWNLVSEGEDNAATALSTSLRTVNSLLYS